MSVATLFGAVLCTPNPASASAIIGVVAVGFGQVGVSLSGTDFLSYNGASGKCNVSGSDPGCFDIESGTGSFAALANTVIPVANNQIKDLPAPPLSGPESISDFISFDDNQVSFDLVEVEPGGGTNCALLPSLSVGNISCTIYSPDGTQISPYLLTSDANGDTVSITATMYFTGYSGSLATGSTPYVGIFSTQFTGTIQSIYSAITSNQTETNTSSASFSPSAPEPGTSVLVGLGLAALGWSRVRRNSLYKSL